MDYEEPEVTQCGDFFVCDNPSDFSEDDCPYVYGNIAKGTTDPRIEFILPK